LKKSDSRCDEWSIQATIVEHLHARAAKGVFWFHAAQNPRSAIHGAMLKAIGLRAGVPDIVCIREGQAYGLEIKTETGRLSAAQRIAHAEMTAAGAEVAVAHGIDEALAVLQQWGLLR
jgi:hypothetical protein